MLQGKFVCKAVVCLNTPHTLFWLSAGACLSFGDSEILPSPSPVPTGADRTRCKENGCIDAPEHPPMDHKTTTGFVCEITCSASVQEVAGLVGLPDLRLDLDIPLGPEARQAVPMRPYRVVASPAHLHLYTDGPFRRCEGLSSWATVAVMEDSGGSYHFQGCWGASV